MEDDNALDIVRFIFKDETPVDIEGNVEIEYEGRPTKWHAKLRGNLMALKPSEVVAEPMLIVCEKTQVEKVDGKHAFLLKTGTSETVVGLETEEELDKWLVKLSTCSHRLAYAELDEAFRSYYSRQVAEIGAGTHESSWCRYFLTAPCRREHSFSVVQSLSSPNRIVICEEVMYESKLSSILPLEFVKMCKQWYVRLRDDIRDKLYGVRNASMQEAAHNAMRHLNSNIENYVQAVEFLEAYEGPSFRPSREKYRIAFAPVPTNLHVQYFHVAGGSSAYWITSGAVSAMPLRFANGGLSRIRHTLQASLDPNGVDHTLETRFHNRQQVLQNAKRCIGELTRRIDNEWHLTAFGTPDNVGLRILADVKQVHETVIDLINSFPNIGNIVDSLCPDGLAGFRNSPVKDTLSNQTDCIEACMTSLNSKMAVLDKVDDNEKGRQFFVDCAKSALNSTLDSLLQLVDSLLLAQLLGLVLALRKQSDSQLFFHLQQRQDFVLSQAVTVVCTALLASIERLSVESLTAWDSVPPLFTFFSFLSCHGDERGMIEDMNEIWTTFPGRVMFRFMAASSSVSQTCVPHLTGTRTQVQVTIPLLTSGQEKLPPKLAAGEWFHVRTVFWNIGINHEATLAASVGDVTLEEGINRAALIVTESYAATYPQRPTAVDDMIAELKVQVNECPGRKNVAIFPKAMALTSALGGSIAVACKSGKDRTSMAVTLEEGRVLRENCGISQQQMSEIVDCLRKSGVRRENCRKNIGKAVFSFSPFQLQFLPKEFRPPTGTYAQNVAS